jgi:hypothetical protein
VSLRALWSYLAIGLPVLAAFLAPMSTVDLTYQLRAGAEMLATGAIPAQDTWTFTVAGTPWFDQQWGAQIILRLVEQLGGWTGLVLVRAGVTATIVGSVFYVARRRGLDARTAALLTLAAFVVAAPAMALRPQLFGLALFGLLLVVIELRHSRPRVLWLAPVIVAVWANIHGSFFIGPLSLGLAWLADVGQRSGTARRTLAVAALGAVAACITPHGPAVWVYAAGLSSDPGVTSLITEWQPTSLRTPAGILFFASALAVVAVLARRGRATDWPTLLWLAVFFAIGAYAERGVAWWALGGGVAVAGLIEPAVARDRTDPDLIRRVNAVTAVAIAVVAVVLLPIWRPLDPGTRAPAGLLSDAPSGITGALRDVVAPGDRIFNPQRWGSWFEYASPEGLVAVDSRVELIPTDVWSRYERIRSGAPGWQTDLDTMAVDYVVAMPSDIAFRDRLLGAGWITAYAGADGSLLTTATS